MLLLLLVFLSGQLSAFLYCSIISVLEIKKIQFIQYLLYITLRTTNLFSRKKCVILLPTKNTHFAIGDKKNSCPSIVNVKAHCKPKPCKAYRELPVTQLS